MKMKSIALFAMTGLVAASIAYIAPAMAADTSNVGTGASPMPGSPNMPGSPDNSMQNEGSNNSATNPSDNMSNNNGTGSNTGSSPNTDEGSPDTATGDDDY